MHGLVRYVLYNSYLYQGKYLFVAFKEMSSWPWGFWNLFWIILVMAQIYLSLWINLCSNVSLSLSSSHFWGDNIIQCLPCTVDEVSGPAQVPAQPSAGRAHVCNIVEFSEWMSSVLYCCHFNNFVIIILIKPCFSYH